ncbi:hypothetical protein [Mucilaginibacter sp. PAMB04168]|uniref:hypothetical protein n=1 Tax=Mucilaginibacter sp. PAMB04168 TaxID=3138567 RepID=UPI0031F66AE6
MKKLILIPLAILALGCKRKVDEKTQVLDSLRSVYAGKEVSVTLSNNQAGTEPLTDQYAYTDENKSDIAFKLIEGGKYLLDSSEGTYIETTANVGQDRTDMVLIESLNGSDFHKRGYVSYKYVWEIVNALPYGFDK